MPRSMWKGTLNFGLVSVPVKLYSAAVHKNVTFHQLHARDHARIVQRRFCSAEGEEVDYGEVVKGYELAPGRYVVVEPEELAALEPVFTRTIDVEDFVQLEEIDAVYFDRPYFLVPNKGGARSYRLLLEAMRETGKVAIGRIVLRSREQLVAIRPREDALMMVTMNFGDEIQQTSSFTELEEADIEVSERELEMARRLVESVTRPFDVGNYHDTYREALLDLIDRKANGEQVVLEPPVGDERLQAPDLMSALEASLEEVRARSGEDGMPSPRKRKAKPAAGKGAAPNGKSARAGGKSTSANGQAATPKPRRKAAPKAR
ncbi:MAG TPA: Ku protein [Solirubrobacteraceae bacterium]